ncbi:MAG TPA: helix-turn-helix domain-containing protein, partial [Xanthobacteraceae bacterium]|nr:helix-turn-helix domain-containing protein [Xanthobacteraceae bacterium]
MSKIVERTLDLLELFAEEKRPLSLSDIARLLKIPVSSCHDVLQAMQARGYLYEVAPRAGYYPTMRLQALGKVISDNDPVVARAEQLLRPLRDTLDESVLLSKVSGLQLRYLLAFEPSHPLRFLVQVGDSVRSLHATSGGKALLASLDDSARQLSQVHRARAADDTDDHLERAAPGHRTWSRTELVPQSGREHRRGHDNLSLVPLEHRRLHRHGGGTLL